MRMTTSRRERVGLATLLTVTAALYLWHLSSNGYGNDFYAAAAQAGAQSWSAWFYGALDAHDFITVDKPPAALWITGLSVRLFGMSPWSVLVPQAVMGVAAVAVLYATVRRTLTGTPQAAAGALLAGAVLALTPAAALMFRFDNPDALLVLLLVAAAYCVTRAIESACVWWPVAAGAALGAAFLTKMLEGFVVAPAFALTYLFLSSATWPRRVGHLLAGAAALVLTAGWWIVAVQLIPPGERPFIGGSTDDTELELAMGYNGMDRIVGSGRTTHTGIARMFTGEFGIEIAWLLPTAAVAVVFGVHLALRRRLPRPQLAALLMWTAWLLVATAVFGYMRGMVHAYYTVVLAPAIGALIGCAAVWGWQRRVHVDGRAGLSAMAVSAALSAAVLLHRIGFESPRALAAIVGAASVAALGLLAGRRFARAAGVLGIGVALLPTAGFTVATVMTPHHGSQPLAVQQTRNGGWVDDLASNRDLAHLLATATTPWSAATNGSQAAAALEVASGTSVMAVGGWRGDPVPTLPEFIDDVHARLVTFYVEAGRPQHGVVIRSANPTRAHTREIADWVAAHYAGVRFGSSTVYRLL
ncbi:glycosyltransferase family 39 protein [Mycolicibacterium goodii]|uniref:Glycosyltransferase family 39 protein n=2 Tax=Mycolicibacterium goodii TaxID=134601 RepID=A0ABS6HSW0_MYCGD|nr:glycosyltransferase family 39 protein [Mycolicibacterium goodii]MBU8840833.1 glycosyltransferase family 39 protein [Mycolicibacterium goodii]